jgi:quercetin dioxygenase-like cupin family protein
MSSADPDGPRDVDYEGTDRGASVSVILTDGEPGSGPRLHRHPYDETWVVQEGRVRFRLGDTELVAGPGELVLAPPNAPHKFTVEGPGRAKMVCIHANPTFETEWLE